MNFVLQIALENAVLVALVAPLVWALSRLLRRPALTHALWLILLIKLVTPPLFRPPIPLARETASTDILAVAQPNPGQSLQLNLFRAAAEMPALTAQVDSAPAPLHVATVDPPPLKTPLTIPIIPLLQTLWLMGSAVCLIIALGRIIRFSRGLRYANPAPPDLQARVARLSRRLGLSSAPTVQFVSGPMCPMLWAVGRSPRLLIPVALWGKLDPGERDTIILHELAHWRRRDHWVRWIELAATTIYWWNPVCWIARRELREAEEQCCDAWVLHATGDFKPYANALLRAVEFISTPAPSSPRHNPLPALASGMGQFNHLKRRIVMLKTASVARALSPRTLLAALAFSAALLPLSPSLKGADEKTPPPAPVTVETKFVRVAEVNESPVTTTLKAPLLLEVTLDDSASPEEQLQAARKQIAELRARLDQAEARLAMYKTREDKGDRLIITRDPLSSTQTTITKLDLDRAHDAQAKMEADIAYKREVLAKSTIRDDKNRTIITDPTTGRIIKEDTRRPLTPPATTAQQADRLDKLESQLRSLLKELESIRQQSTSETHDIPARK